ncbi:MAG: DUF4321 domain-containing protein [Oscillospiraceae bacterium]
MKKQFLFLFYLLAGILTGSLLAGLCAKVPALSWLGYTNSIGFSPSNPAVLDLIIIKITFGFSMAISIAQVITISLAMFLFSKTRIK